MLNVSPGGRLTKAAAEHGHLLELQRSNTGLDRPA